MFIPDFDYYDYLGPTSGIPQAPEVPEESGSVQDLQNQDQTILNRVYRSINDWRRSEGVPDMISPKGLEEIVQSAGYIWTNSQARSVDKKVNGKINVVKQCIIL